MKKWFNNILTGSSKSLNILLILSLIVSLYFSFNFYNKNNQLQSKQQALIKENKRLSNIKIKKPNPSVATTKHSDEAKEKPYYKNEKFAYIVNYPTRWSKTESSKNDGFTLSNNNQKIIIYGVYDSRKDKNINTYLESEFGDSILSKEEIQAVNTEGWIVSTEMEQFIIFQSWNNFVLIYTELPADENTINAMEKMARSFQILGE